MSLAQHRILVTGATGNIGRELVIALNAKGADFVAASSKPLDIPGVPTVQADFASVESLTRAFNGIHTLFLLLPLVPEKVDYARNAVAAAKAAGVRHIVRSSGVGAATDSPWLLNRLQGEVDQIIIDSGLPYTLTRPATFMQNFATYFAQPVRDGALYLPQGEGRSAYVDVRDIAAANAAILLAPEAHAGRIYVLTGPAAISNSEAVAAIGKATGRPAHYVPVPDAAGIEAMQGMGMPAWTIDVMMSLHHLTAAGAAATVTDDVRTLTGREAITFAQFVQDNLAVWK